MRLLATGPRRGFQSLKVSLSLVTSNMGGPDPAKPPPPPKVPPNPRPALWPDDESEFPSKRATRKARSISSIFVAMVSTADFSMGGSARRKKAAAESY